MGRKKYKNPAKGENTVIGSGTVINGGITSDSMVIRIDGKVNGEIVSKGEIIVGTNGIILGDVEAASLIIAGEIKGNVNVSHRLDMEAGAKILGDVKTSLLSISETAILQGKVSMPVSEEKKSEDKASDNEPVNNKANDDKTDDENNGGEKVESHE